MDWSIVGTLLTAVVGVTVATWTVVRERSPLRELERITAVLKDTPEDAPRRRELEVIRDHLSQRLNARYRAPREVVGRFLAVYCMLSGVLLGGFGFVIVALAPEYSSPAALVIYAVFSGISVTIGALVLASIRRYRKRWLLTVIESEDIESTDKPLL